MIAGKFAIARNLDNYIYLLELNELFDLQSQVRIGDDDSWGYAADGSNVYC